MKLSRLLFIGSLIATNLARAVVVEFYGTGTHQEWNGTGLSTLPFSVAFSYDTDATAIDTYPTQVLRPAASLSLTIKMVDGSTWTHTSTDVRITMNNAVNGSWDGITISTKWPMTETAPLFSVSGTPYPVVNYSFELTKYAGGVFADGDFSLPVSPTFIGDLADWNVKHAKLYINTGTNDVSFFNRPVDTMGAPLAPIPEPSTWAAILGAVALGGVIWTRRRQARA